MSVLIPILSLTVWVMIEVMAVLNFSLTIPIQSWGGISLGFFILSAAAAYIIPAAVLREKKRSRFFILFAAGLGLQILTAALAGKFIHRDFYSFPSPLVMLYAAILIVRLDSLGIVRNRTGVYRTISVCGLVVFIMWISWIMLMSYAIVARTEPRWIESTGYNLVNGIIGLVFLSSVVMLWERSKRRLCVSGRYLMLDERNVSSMLSAQENNIIRAFLDSPTRSLNCGSLYNVLTVLGGEGDNTRPECGQCITEKWTATACPVYRNYKNRIKDTKKYLELLQIGTIVPVSENPREVKDLGWMLRFFDDVHFEDGRHRRKM